jgi:transposase
MNHIRDIIHRLQQGESERQICRDTRISRPTIHKYKEWAQAQGYLKPDSSLPSPEVLVAALGPSTPPPRPRSSLEAYRDKIAAWQKEGVEMMAMWHRLQEDYDYPGSYSAVRRFCNRLRPHSPEAVVRVHTAPGEEMQVDFGYIGKIYDPRSGRMRKAYVFVATLSHSRHQYAEIVFDQKIATWLALHRRAFEYFGGVPRRVVPDNLKAAVTQALIIDPVLAEAYRRFALHYQFLISPTRPRTPQHKGKVENGVHYVKRNFIAGRTFGDIDAANARLKVWVKEIAGARIHGTTRQAPWQVFHDLEHAALHPLPETPFHLLAIKPVKVHRDCHITLDGNYYSVPYRYIGQRLDAHIHEKMIHLYAGTELVVSHIRSLDSGQWTTRLDDYPPHKADYLKRTPPHCRQSAQRIGPATETLINTLLDSRPLDRLRAAQNVLRLEEKVGPKRLEHACARAIYFGDIQYRRVKQILNAGLDHEALPVESGPDNPLVRFEFARDAQEFFPQAEVSQC